ncbi:hypothetical protein [cf. Phormidesmis sp. LEGE 11477]|uniref:DUF6972 family protein n=1 Tax=cf. Phormidesmis sp. LEGE 11477 TaxID=1828680 RepID=UPI00187F0100|nr:hypothetical protein [cf. Phormidesmis sp. LEGE 11477]
MSGIDREIILDRRHLAKHLPDTPQSDRLLQRGRAAHVFKDEDTLFQVAQAILIRGVYTGFARGYDRYGLVFAEAIGLRIDPDGSTFPLFYGEVKIDADNRYHPIPRTRPSEE